MKRLPIDAVVIISPFGWPGPKDMWQATHHVAVGFARRYPTVFVEPPLQWNPASDAFDGRHLVSSVFGASTRPVANNLLVVRRRNMPLGRLGPVRRFDARRHAARLRDELTRRGYGRPLLWHSFPYGTAHLRPAVSPALFAYHCLDHSERTEERALVEGADAVFAVSEALASRLRDWNPRTTLLQNGVDLTLFNPDYAKARQRPRDLPTAGRLIGFTGSINYHFDVDAMLYVARAFPQDSLVLLGRIMKGETGPGPRESKALDALLKLPNVHFLGFRPAEQLAAYLAAFDVCLNPLLPDPFNAERDPMKFYQYLAMGKPIVTSPSSTADSHAGLCYVADSSEQFIVRTADALSERDPALGAARQTAAQRHSWDSRVEYACDVLADIKESGAAVGATNRRRSRP